jgi:hypothetical protein
MAKCGGHQLATAMTIFGSQRRPYVVFTNIATHSQRNCHDGTLLELAP